MKNKSESYMQGRKIALLRTAVLATLVLVCAVLLTSGLAAAATLVVNQTAPPCAEANPDVPGNYFTTIQAAIDAAGEGDTIIVCNGTYTENILINKSRLTIHSFAGSAATIISSAALNMDVVTIVDATEVTLDGFTIRDARGTAADVSGINMTNANGCTIMNTVVTNITDDVHAFGISMTDSNENALTNLWITNVSAYEAAYGLFPVRSSNNTFTDVSVDNVAAAEIASGIFQASSDTNDFERIAVTNVSAQGFALGIFLVNSQENTFMSTEVAYIDAIWLVTGPLGQPANLDEFDIISVTVEYENTACGICLVVSPNNTFSSTNVSYINATGMPPGQSDDGLGVSTLTVNISTANTAVGIWLIVSDGNTFTTTAVRHVMATEGLVEGVGQPSIGSDEGNLTVEIFTGNCAFGIWLAVSNENTFTTSEVSYIAVTEGGLLSVQPGEGIVGSDVTYVIGRGGIAYGVWLVVSTDNTFDTSTISHISAETSAYGAELIGSDGTDFSQFAISDLTTGWGDTTYGVYLLWGEQNRLAAGTISRGDGPMIDYGVWLTWTLGNVIERCRITDCGAGIYTSSSEGNEFVGNTIEDNGDGIVLTGGANNNTIEGNMIRNNKGAGTGVHIDASSDANEIHRNCFFYNEPYQAFDDFSGFSNHWDGNYWEPTPGDSADPYAIPGNASSIDNNPLSYCPLCAMAVPTLTPVGIAALTGLLSVIAITTIERKKR